MSLKKELKVAYGLAIVLLFVGVVCYAIPQEQPEKPVRKMFKCIAGKVLFTHEKHFATSATGYGLTCSECHHHYEDNPDEIKACGECHAKDITKTVPETCMNCHEPDEVHHPGEEAEYECSACHQKSDDEESVPTACTDCHDVDDLEGMERQMNMQARTDAFHNQCITCHKNYGKQAPVACDACHVK